MVAKDRIGDYAVSRPVALSLPLGLRWRSELCECWLVLSLSAVRVWCRAIECFRSPPAYIALFVVPRCVLSFYSAALSFGCVPGTSAKIDKLEKIDKTYRGQSGD